MLAGRALVVRGAGPAARVPEVLVRRIRLGVGRTARIPVLVAASFLAPNFGVPAASHLVGERQQPRVRCRCRLRSSVWFC